MSKRSRADQAKDKYTKARGMEQKKKQAYDPMMKSRLIRHDADKKTKHSETFKADYEGERMYSGGKDPFAHESKKRPTTASGKARAKTQKAEKSKLSKQTRKYHNNAYKEGE